MKRILHFLFLAFLAKATLAAQTTSTGNVWLVAVGIGAYQHDDILTRLDFTIQGAYDFSILFDDRQLLGSNPHVLTNQKARRTDIVRTLENTFVNNPEVKPEDMVLFYFSGHGEIAGGKAGICPYDFADDVRGLITDEEIQGIMQRSPARHKACFIEACKTEAQSGTIFDPSILENFNQKRRSIGGGLIYMTSTKAGEKSWGKPDIGGFFTHFLLRGLKGEANANDDAFITVDELFDFVQRGVKSFSLDKQIPQINDLKGYDPAMPLMVIPEKLAKQKLKSVEPVVTETAHTGTSPSNEYYPPGFEYLAADMIFISSGEFDMGDIFNEGKNDEKPVHRVKVNGFYLSRYEVTQALWISVMGDNPSYYKNCDNCPVEYVTWDDVQQFIKILNEKTGKNFRLPTEAEWEFAARERGKKVRFGNGKEIADSREMNFDGSESLKKSYSIAGEYRQNTVQVTSFSPNSLGLYNMSGNVWEWCQDVWHETYSDSPTDGSAWTGGAYQSYRVVRGGSYNLSPDHSRSAFRGKLNATAQVPDIGFRLAR